MIQESILKGEKEVKKMKKKHKTLQEEYEELIDKISKRAEDFYKLEEKTGVRVEDWEKKLDKILNRFSVYRKDDSYNAYEQRDSEGSWDVDKDVLKLKLFIKQEKQKAYQQVKKEILEKIKRWINKIKAGKN